jgi:hypothetical protein
MGESMGRWAMYFVFAVAGLSLTGCGQAPVSTFTRVITPDGPKLYAWGNSQTQGYGLSGCNTLVCHPAYAWPQLFANAMGWTLDTQAYGSSDCADLTYSGTSLSLWDLQIDANSRNIYAHFRNDQSSYGPLPYRVAYARGCIEAQTAWLAIPESAKVRGNSSSTVNTGAWENATQNSAGSFSMTTGASKTFVVTGTTVYLATARMADGGSTRYTVSVDGNLVTDPATNSTTFDQNLDDAGIAGVPVNEGLIQNFIRVPGLSDVQHTIVYTCLVPSVTGCYVFYAAGVSATTNATASGPVVYSLSTVPNSFRNRSENMGISTTSLYHDAWVQMVAELDGDGLQVVGLDTTDPHVYNPTLESQPDGVHPSLTGHVSIAAAMVAKATAQASAK